MILQVFKAELAQTIPDPYLKVELSGLVNVKEAQKEASMYRHPVNLKYSVMVDYAGEIHATVGTVYRDLDVRRRCQFCHTL